MTKLPRVTGKGMCRLLEKLGFEKIGQKEAMLDTNTVTEEGLLCRFTGTGNSALDRPTKF